MKRVGMAVSIAVTVASGVSLAIAQTPQGQAVRSIPPQFQGEWGSSASACQNADFYSISTTEIEVGPSGTTFVSGTLAGNEFRMRGTADLDGPGRRKVREDIVMVVQGNRLRYTSAVQGKRPETQSLVRCGTSPTQSEQRPTQASSSQKIPYGSRVGMEVDVVSTQGLNTRSAVVMVRHTAQNARAFCVGYSLDNSQRCVDRLLAELKVPDRVTANCGTGEFVTLNRETLLFQGRNPKARRGNLDEPEYVIKRAGEALDRSTASGYDVALAQFKSLCPDRAKGL